MDSRDKTVPFTRRAAGTASGGEGGVGIRADASVQGEHRRGPARILVVEDETDIRRLLVTALEIEGHIVDEATNAEEGLKRLHDASYNLVLSDYAMPGGTGMWMLHEATRLGLMDRTVALVVTATPDARDLQGVEVVRKPLDFDAFLEQVRHIVGRATAPAADTMAKGAEKPGRHRIELVLYISSASPASIQARRNLERLLEGFEQSQVKLTVCDLGRDPRAGEADRIAFTPTLVKRFPDPPLWVLGNLRETELIADLLRVCGVDVKG